ncbi:hypothetical protein NQ315_006871, partial [Exocentrus adspersus]
HTVAINMSSPVVKIIHGRLQGKVQVDIDGGRFFSFLGVPYAKPPLEDLRFKAPVPVDPWEGTRDATKEGSGCYSRHDIDGTMEGSEDCLNLNVFTKELPGRNIKPRPVMVWIHGGGFVWGSNRTSVYGPEFLMTEDIVLVTINYRLGLLGFLSLKDDSLGIPGNAGFKDQRLALKWVQENIRYFNGDPNNVTIFGESAGAASVHLQVLSSSSEGLFHRAILQSGCALNSWAHGSCATEKLVEYLKRDTAYETVKTEKEIYEYLKTLTVEELYTVQIGIESEINPSTTRVIGAVIEQPNESAFLTRNVLDIIKSGNYNKVPLWFGYTSREGIFIEVLKTMTNAPGEVPTEERKLGSNMPWQQDNPALKKKFEAIYFSGTNESDNQYKLITDSWFLMGIMASIKNHLATNPQPMYLYRMSLDSGLNFMKNLAKLNHVPGTSHADDLGYLFKSAITPEIKPGNLEDISLRRFVKLWTNFAKYGNPTPDEELGVILEPLKLGQLNFLDIGNELTVGVNPESERIDLWKEIYQMNPETVDYL